MMHFIKQMLESDIRSLGFLASFTGPNINFLLYLFPFNETTIPKELIPAIKIDLNFQITL
jgi:hypothetical protein